MRPLIWLTLAALLAGGMPTSPSSDYYDASSLGRGAEREHKETKWNLSRATARRANPSTVRIRIPPEQQSETHAPLVAPLDTFTSESCATSNYSGVVRIPAVRKGLNNQRMRIIQDIVIARMLGMAVELPKIVRTRMDCGYREGCYKNYDNFVPFENVFNYAEIVKRLKELDICVVESSLNFTEIPVVAGEGTCCVWCVSAARACCYWFTFDLLASLLQVWHGRWTHLQYRISALERTNSMGMCGRLVPKRTAAPSS